MRKIQKFMRKNWFNIIALTAGLVLVVGLFFWSLNSLTHGISEAEVAYLDSSTSLTKILNNSVFLPHKLLVKVTASLSPRLVSALFSIIFIFFFYATVRRWFTKRISILSTVLFACSSWLLVIGRQGLPTIMYISWLPMLGLLYWTVSKSKQTSASFLWAVSAALSFYTPGLLWFVALVATTQKNRLLRMLRSLPKWQIAVSWAVFILLLIPFMVMTINNPNQSLASLGLPTDFSQILNFPKVLLYNLFGVFIYGQSAPLFRLGHLPYLDIVTTLLFLLGLYKLRFSGSHKMIKISSIIIGGWIVGIGLNTINVAIILPIIYIFAGAGISFLLIQWQSVFPTNPFAKQTGILIVVALTLFISYHHIFRYFIAWPNNPNTRDVFSNQVLK